MAAAAQAAALAALSADSVQVQQKRHQKKHFHLLSFPCSSFLGNRGFSTRPLLQKNHRSRPASWISPVSEVAVDGSANAAAVAPLRLDVKSEDTPAAEPPATVKEATISAVMSDVVKLVKLVDSRDIVELELKHLDYELVIKKKQALLPPPPPVFTAPQIVAQAPYPTYAPLPPAPASAPASAPYPAPVAASLPVPAAVPASNLLRILSPMAGTFYKNPAPGESPFVKVGDKVTKGQVICIVEAMKLMNEIEADQTGTVVEILAEDGKPVAVDTVSLLPYHCFCLFLP